MPGWFVGAGRRRPAWCRRGRGAPRLAPRARPAAAAPPSARTTCPAAASASSARACSRRRPGRPRPLVVESASAAAATRPITIRRMGSPRECLSLCIRPAGRRQPARPDGRASLAPAPQPLRQAAGARRASLAVHSAPCRVRVLSSRPLGRCRLRRGTLARLRRRLHAGGAGGHRGAGAVRSRSRRADAGADGRRAAGRRRATPIGFLDPDGIIRARRSGWPTPAPAGSTAARSRPTSSASGSRAPAGRPAAARRSRRSLRNVAYALLSGADGWMFDGEDALGQVSTMSLDNQRNLALAIARDPVFLDVAAEVAGRDERAGRAAFFGRRDRRRLARAARLHDADLPRPRPAPRRPPRALGRRHRLLRLDRRRRPLRRQQPRQPARRWRGRWCSTCRRSRPPRKRRSGTTCSTRSSGTLGLPRARSRPTCSSSRSRPASS